MSYLYRKHVYAKYANNKENKSLRSDGGACALGLGELFSPEEEKEPSTARILAMFDVDR
jgi:hypothetical protein